MQVIYSLGQRDYLEYHRRLVRTVRTSPATIILGWVILAGVGFVVASLSPLTRGNWLHVALLAVAITLLFRGLAYLSVRANALRAYLDQPGARAECVLVLNDWGMASNRLGMTSRVLWGDIASITEERGYLMFLSHPLVNSMQISIFFVPIRAFATTSEKSAFLAEAQRLRAEAKPHPPVVPTWPPLETDPARLITVSYPLTVGEIVWMRTLAQTRSPFAIHVWRPFLATVCGYPIYWLMFGSWKTAFAAVAVWPIVALTLWNTSRAGPVSKGKSAEVVGDYRLTLAPEGVEQQAPTGLGTMPWSVIVQIVERNRHVVFFGEKSPVCIVPLSAFGSADEAQAFLKTALDYWQSAKDGTAAPLPTRSAAWPPPPSR